MLVSVSYDELIINMSKAIIVLQCSISCCYYVYFIIIINSATHAYTILLLCIKHMQMRKICIMVIVLWQCCTSPLSMYICIHKSSVL